MNSRNLAVCEHRDGPEGVAEWPKPGRERQTRGRRPGPSHHGTGPSVQRLHAHVTQRHSTDHDRRGAAGLRPTSPSVGWTVAPSARAVTLATRARHGEAGSAPCKCKVQRARGWAGRGWRRSGSAPGREQKPRAGSASAPRAAGAAAAAHVSAPGDSERAGTHGARARARHALCQDARALSRGPETGGHMPVTPVAAHATTVLLLLALLLVSRCAQFTDRTPSVHTGLGALRGPRNVSPRMRGTAAPCDLSHMQNLKCMWVGEGLSLCSNRKLSILTRWHHKPRSKEKFISRGTCLHLGAVTHPGKFIGRRPHT